MNLSKYSLWAIDSRINELERMAIENSREHDPRIKRDEVESRNAEHELSSLRADQSAARKAFVTN